MSKPLTFAIVGAGTRGEFFADWIARRPEVGRVVAVADPAAVRRELVAARCGIAPDMQFESWADLLAGPRLADVLINATMDRDHGPVCLQALSQGYHMLLEKPMATTPAECVEVDRLARQHGCIVAVCHSLRYIPVWKKVKSLLDEGAIGRLISFDQTEGVGPEHFAHSYVRGNWNSRRCGTFMLMAKNCHDIDQLAWMVARPCRRVSSFGELSLFTAANCPPGAPAYCVQNCPHEKTCLYSAIRIYGPNPLPYRWEQAKMPADGAARMDLLKTSPYGRCVWRCDNEMVDHQIVAMEFDGGVTGTFTMTAYAKMERRLFLSGTTGTIRAQLETGQIELYNFATDRQEEIAITQEGAEDHSGGDAQVIATLAAAVAAGDASLVRSSTSETLQTHKIVFAAEQSRLEGRVVSL